MVTTGELFFLGGVRGAGVSAFFFLRLAGLSVSRLLRAIATGSKMKIRVYRGRTFGACRKQVFPDGCHPYTNLFFDIMKYQWAFFYEVDYPEQGGIEKPGILFQESGVLSSAFRKTT